MTQAAEPGAEVAQRQGRADGQGERGVTPPLRPEERDREGAHDADRGGVDERADGGLAVPQREHGDDEGRAVREQHAGVERGGSAGRGVEARERDRRRAVPHARVRIRREGGAVRVARRGEQAVEEELADAHRGDEAPQRRARAGERDGRERREREPERHDGPRRGGTAARLVE